MTVPMLVPLVMIAAAVYDFCIARYVVAVSAKKPHRAGAWSAATYIVGLIGTLGIIKVSLWLILPECVGLYLGTVIAVSEKKKDEA